MFFITVFNNTYKASLLRENKERKKYLRYNPLKKKKKTIKDTRYSWKKNKTKKDKIVSKKKKRRRKIRRDSREKRPKV